MLWQETDLHWWYIIHLMVHYDCRSCIYQYMVNQLAVNNISLGCVAISDTLSASLINCWASRSVSCQNNQSNLQLLDKSNHPHYHMSYQPLISLFNKCIPLTCIRAVQELQDQIVSKQTFSCRKEASRLSRHDWMLMQQMTNKISVM